MTAAELVVDPAYQRPTPVLCQACGHRPSLHGFLLQETWCIAWNGSMFCGCQITAVPTDEHEEVGS